MSDEPTRKEAERHYSETHYARVEGFVPELAESLCERLKQIEGILCANGGKAEFPALFSSDTGSLIPAVLEPRAYGFVWAIKETDNPHSQTIREFWPSKALKAHVERQHNAKHGYYVGTVLAPARVKVVGYNGFIIVRKDDGFSRDVTIIDNGSNSVADCNLTEEVS